MTCPTAADCAADPDRTDGGCGCGAARRRVLALLSLALLSRRPRA